MWSPALLRVIMSLSVLMTPTIRSLTTNCCEIINFHPEPNQITLLLLPQEYYFVLLAALVQHIYHSIHYHARTSQAIQIKIQIKRK